MRAVWHSALIETRGLMYLFLELNHCFVGDRRRCRGAEQIHAHIRGPFQHDPRATGTRPIRPTIGLVAGTCDPGAGAAGAGCGRCEAANIQGTTRAGGHARRRATARRLRGLRPLRGGSNAQALRNEFHGARAGGRAQGQSDGERLGNGGLDGAPRHVARWPQATGITYAARSHTFSRCSSATCITRSAARS